MTTTINASTTAGLVQTADTSGVLALQTAGTTAVTVDASQSVGIGVTPSTWTGVGASVLQIGAAGASIIGNSSTIDVIGNAVYNSGWKYATTAGAGYYAVNNGLHIWYSAASGTAGNAITFAESMRIDTSGNVGIGGTPSGSYKLQLIGTAATTFGAWGVTGTTTAGAYAQFVNTGNTTIIGVESSAGASLCGGTSAYATIFGTSSAASVQFVTNNSTRATIDSSGNLLVGLTSGAGERLSVVASSGNATMSVQVSANGNAGVSFKNVSTTTVGQIVVNAATTAYNTSSDYRLKNTIAPMTGALTKVQALKPVTYKWNIDDEVGEGFIAHELAEVCPHAVNGQKDAVDADGNPVYQGIDVSFLVATLTAAIQEQQALITQLQADVAALKGA